MKMVTQAYLLGVKEGREFLRAFPETDPRDMVEAITRTLAEGFSGDMAEFMRGERDFWKNQAKRK